MLFTVLKKIKRNRQKKKEYEETEARRFIRVVLGMKSAAQESLNKFLIDEYWEEAHDENEERDYLRQMARQFKDLREMKNPDGTWKLPSLTLYRRYCQLYEHMHGGCCALEVSNGYWDKEILQHAKDTLPLKPLTYKDLVYHKTGKYPSIRRESFEKERKNDKPESR